MLRADTATSQPIQPAPTIATRPCGVEALAQRVAVGERAQLADAVELGPGQGEPPRPRAGREQQAVVEDALARPERERTARDLDR
jgi:hypothetical protein